MLGLCGYALLVIFNELKVYLDADPSVSHLFMTVLFACQFILCFPCALNQNHGDFEAPTIFGKIGDAVSASTTSIAAAESNLRSKEHARLLRTKNILTVLLINLTSVPYLLYFQDFESPGKVPKFYAINHVLISCVMVYRLIYYHCESKQSQVAASTTSIKSEILSAASAFEGVDKKKD